MITIYFDEAKTTGVGIARPEELPQGETEKKIVAGLAFKSQETGVKMWLLDKAEALVIARELIRLAELSQDD